MFPERIKHKEASFLGLFKLGKVWKKQLTGSQIHHYLAMVQKKKGFDMFSSCFLGTRFDPPPYIYLGCSRVPFYGFSPKHNPKGLRPEGLFWVHLWSVKIDTWNKTRLRSCLFSGTLELRFSSHKHFVQKKKHPYRIYGWLVRNTSITRLFCPIHLLHSSLYDEALADAFHRISLSTGLVLPQLYSSEATSAQQTHLPQEKTQTLGLSGLCFATGRSAVWVF